MPNVDTIYQRVLALANKEQRGYITPQEFNLLANKAQLIIFEQYFYKIRGASSIVGELTCYGSPDRCPLWTHLVFSVMNFHFPKIKFIAPLPVRAHHCLKVPGCSLRKPRDKASC